MHQSIIIQVPCISKWSWNAWIQVLVHTWASRTPIHAPVHYDPSLFFFFFRGPSTASEASCARGIVLGMGAR
jgi:hypothetical protein